MQFVFHYFVSNSTSLFIRVGIQYDNYEKTQTLLAGAVMLFHHMLGIYGQAVVLYTGRDGVEMMAVLFGAEFSNPFLQLRWFFRSLERHHSLLAEINDHLFMLTFFFWRICIGTVLLYCTWTHPLPELHAKLGGLAIYLLGWVFWVMIVNYAVKKYRKMWRKWKGVTSLSSDNKVDATAHTEVDNDVTEGDNDVTVLKKRLGTSRSTDSNSSSGVCSNGSAVSNGHSGHVKSE